VEAVNGRIEPYTILSHDLLEGELSGSALLSDIALYDSQPATLRSWMKRLHRWTRGDWQLLPWLLPGKEKKGLGENRSPGFPATKYGTICAGA
jgi:hypothetical protein